MEEGIPCKPVEVSDDFKAHSKEIYDYSLETFGYFQTERYMNKIEKAVDTLPCNYTAHTPCRHIPTKSHMYRNIILDSHLIIYRIKADRIEVLDIVHSASSISKIRRTRKIKL
jgi:plasmid stabilization system protein ParE